MSDSIPGATAADSGDAGAMKFDAPVQVAHELAGPVTQTERIVAIDVLRGVALLGILVMNIRFFATVGAVYSNPTAYGDWTGINFVVWLLAHVLADTKMMTIFSMLFGAGIVLMASRQEAKGLPSAGVHYKRMGWLLLIGLFHAHVIWAGDILVWYALCGLVVYPVRRWSPAVLIVVGLAMIALASGMSVFLGASMPYWPAEQIAALRESWAPGVEAIQREIESMRGSWLDQAPYRNGFALLVETQVFLLLGFWRAGGAMLVGMALYKLGVFSARRTLRFYTTTLVAGLLIGLPLILYGLKRNIDEGFSMEYSMFVGTQYNYWASLLMALAWVSVVMLVVKAGVLRWLTAGLAAVGQMALTNYLMQSIACTLIFNGHGLGYFGTLDYVQQMYIVVGVWAFQLVASPIWLEHFRFGPAEWLWRSLTYGTLQPMARR